MAETVIKTITKYWWVFAILGGIFALAWIKIELFPGGGGGGERIEYVQGPAPQYVQPSYGFGGKKRGGRRVSKFKH